VALTALDNFCQEHFGWRSKRKRNGKNISYQLNPITRYADDWVPVCGSQQEAENLKREVAQHLKATVGVELSEEKTHITHIFGGFDFLGFHLRKYNIQSRQGGILLIQPQQKKVNQLLHECKSILRTHRASRTGEVIRILNAKLRGWGLYYRHVCSKHTFDRPSGLVSSLQMGNQKTSQTLQGMGSVKILHSERTSIHRQGDRLVSGSIR
jgi:RNA-directed DNA polymerase